MTDRSYLNPPASSRPPQPPPVPPPTKGQQIAAELKRLADALEANSDSLDRPVYAHADAEIASMVKQYNASGAKLGTFFSKPIEELDRDGLLALIWHRNEFDKMQRGTLGGLR